jgi:hypothetical protein
VARWRVFVDVDVDVTGGGFVLQFGGGGGRARAGARGSQGFDLQKGVDGVGQGRDGFGVHLSLLYIWLKYGFIFVVYRLEVMIFMFYMMGIVTIHKLGLLSTGILGFLEVSGIKWRRRLVGGEGILFNLSSHTKSFSQASFDRRRGVGATNGHFAPSAR